MDEIVQGRDRLQRELGRTIEHFAYPFGILGIREIRMAARLGFKTAVTTCSGNLFGIHRHQSHCLPRRNVGHQSCTSRFIRDGLWGADIMKDCGARQESRRYRNIVAASNMNKDKGLFDVFNASAEKYPENVALDVEGRCYTYFELKGLAARLASLIHQHDDDLRPVVAFLAYRSLNAFVSVLGTLAAGKGYVPLHPNFPGQRTAHMISASGAAVLIVGAECSGVLTSVLEKLDRKLTVLCLNLRSLPSTGHPSSAKFLSVPTRAASHESFEPVRPQPRCSVCSCSLPAVPCVPKKATYSIARHCNVLSSLEYTGQRSVLHSAVKITQFRRAFDLTFDFECSSTSFLCWSAGRLSVLPAPEGRAGALAIYS